MNTAWLTGKMPRKMYTHEHPDGPKLRARTYTVRLENDVEQSEEERKEQEEATVGAGT